MYGSPICFSKPASAKALKFSKTSFFFMSAKSYQQDLPKITTNTPKNIQNQSTNFTKSCWA